jgi:hypothetical protein
MLQQLQELTRERDEARNNVAVQADELSHLRQDVCMRNAAIIELRWKLVFQERRASGPRVDVVITTPDRAGTLHPPRDRQHALQAYVVALTTSRAAAFCELACVRQEMGCLAILSFVHRSRSRATECDCNAHETRCAAKWGMLYELPDTVEIRAMEEQESQGRPIDPPGPVVFQRPDLRRLSGTLTSMCLMETFTLTCKPL